MIVLHVTDIHTFSAFVDIPDILSVYLASSFAIDKSFGFYCAGGLLSQPYRSYACDSLGDLYRYVVLEKTTNISLSEVVVRTEGT